MKTAIWQCRSCPTTRRGGECGYYPFGGIQRRCFRDRDHLASTRNQSAAPRHDTRSGASPALAVLPRLRGELPGDRRDLDQPPCHVSAHRPCGRNAAAAERPPPDAGRIPAVPNRRACRSLPPGNRRAGCRRVLRWNPDRSRYLRQCDVAVRGSRASAARHPPHGERGTADRSAVPHRSDRLCDRHRDRAGRALAGAATLPPSQRLLSLASPGSRERSGSHWRPHCDRGSQRRQLTKMETISGKQYQFHIKGKKQCKSANLEKAT